MEGERTSHYNTHMSEEEMEDGDVRLCACNEKGEASMEGLAGSHHRQAEKAGATLLLRRRPTCPPSNITLLSLPV